MFCHRVTVLPAGHRINGKTMTDWWKSVLLNGIEILISKSAQKLCFSVLVAQVCQYTPTQKFIILIQQLPPIAVHFVYRRNWHLRLGYAPNRKLTVFIIFFFSNDSVPNWAWYENDEEMVLQIGGPPPPQKRKCSTENYIWISWFWPLMHTLRITGPIEPPCITPCIFVATDVGPLHNLW